MYSWNEPPTHNMPRQPAPAVVRVRRRGPLSAVLAVLLAAAVGFSVYGLWLSARWEQRAQRAESQYRGIVSRLGVSEADNKGLLTKQQKLAADKAAVEDEKAALARQKDDLEAKSRDLSKQLDVVQQVALKYNQCSAGYSQVIADLAANRVTSETQQKAAAADSACGEADRLVSKLPH